MVESTIVPRFQDQATLRKEFHDLFKQFLLNTVFQKNIPKSAQRISIRHLITGLYPAEIRKSPAVNYFGYRCHIRQVVQILHQIDPKHPFQIVGLISALSFVVVRLGSWLIHSASRYDSVDLCSRNSRFFVRTCVSSSLRADRLICLFMALL